MMSFSGAGPGRLPEGKEVKALRVFGFAFDFREKSLNSQSLPAPQVASQPPGGGFLSWSLIYLTSQREIFFLFVSSSSRAQLAFLVLFSQLGAAEALGLGRCVVLFF